MAAEIDPSHERAPSPCPLPTGQDVAFGCSSDALRSISATPAAAVDSGDSGPFHILLGVRWMEVRSYRNQDVQTGCCVSVVHGEGSCSFFLEITSPPPPPIFPKDSPGCVFCHCCCRYLLHLLHYRFYRPCSGTGVLMYLFLQTFTFNFFFLTFIHNLGKMVGMGNNAKNKKPST